MMIARRNPEVEMAPMKDETVLFNPDNNKFCVLNMTAALLWEELENPKTTEQLVDAVQNNFSDVDAVTVGEDIDKVLNSLIEVQCVLIE
jgi:hypothetical protein